MAVVWYDHHYNVMESLTGDIAYIQLSNCGVTVFDSNTFTCHEETECMRTSLGGVVTFYGMQLWRDSNDDCIFTAYINYTVSSVYHTVLHPSRIWILYTPTSVAIGREFNITGACWAYPREGTDTWAVRFIDDYHTVLVTSPYNMSMWLQPPASAANAVFDPRVATNLAAVDGQIIFSPIVVDNIHSNFTIRFDLVQNVTTTSTTNEFQVYAQHIHMDAIHLSVNVGRPQGFILRESQATLFSSLISAVHVVDHNHNEIVGNAGLDEISIDTTPESKALNITIDKDRTVTSKRCVNGVVLFTDIYFTGNASPMVQLEFFVSNTGNGTTGGISGWECTLTVPQTGRRATCLPFSGCSRTRSRWTTTHALVFRGTPWQRQI